MTPSSAFIQDILGEFPRFRIVYKSKSLWSKLIDLLLKIVTIGGQRAYLTRYFTVMGSTLYVPPTWDQMPEVDRVILLRHERVHLRQRRRLTFLGMAFVYLIPILPLGLAYGRARLEWEAYTETLRATAELKGWSAAADPQLRREIVRRFCGPDYGWMWPFSGTVNRWYDAALAQLASETEHRSTAQQQS
jgi:hypothetical protein